MQEYEKKLFELCEKDPRVVVMTAENRAPIRNLPDLLGERFIDTGITEQTMIGMAAGLALRGRRPVCHALAAFLTMRAFEFIRTDIGIPRLPVKLVGFVPGILSDANGPTHQAIEDVALMRGIPGMQIFAPSDSEELVNGLPEIMASDSPCYIRWHLNKPTIPHVSGFEIGKAETYGLGSDINILSYGFIAKEAYLAAQDLKGKGYSVGFTNLRMLEPLDEQAIVQAARASALLVTVEDHFIRGGLGSMVAETLGLKGISCRLERIGFDGQWFKPALLSDAIQTARLDKLSIMERIEARMKEIKNV